MEEEAEDSRGGVPVVEVNASHHGADSVLGLRARVTVEVVLQVGPVSDPLVEGERVGVEGLRRRRRRKRRRRREMKSLGLSVCFGFGFGFTAGVPEGEKHGDDECKHYPHVQAARHFWCCWLLLLLFPQRSSVLCNKDRKGERKK